MEDEEDDMYAPEEDVATKLEPTHNAPKFKGEEAMDEDSENEDDDDEEEEEDDSDIEIVTEAPPGVKPEPSVQNQRVASGRSLEPAVKPESPAPSAIKPNLSAALRIDPPKKAAEPSRPGSSYPPVHTSTLDIDVKPIHEASGKPIMEVDMDADFGEDDKPWRRPGSDQTDYFNYGFDEFTWASYCLKQENLRKEAKDQKKQLEDMQNFMGMGAGNPPAGPNTMGGMAMGGPADLPPEMQQMMQQMMASGMDPNQMDFNQFMQMMGQGGQQGMGGGFGQGNQQMGNFGGYGNTAGSGGGGGNHGGHGGRANRGRGRW